MRIVIVEDEPKSREGLVNVIQRFTKYEIAGIGENGEEGFELVKKNHPDLVISDIKMPVLDGLGMLQKIKDEQIEIQAILLTGYSEFEYARRALQLQVVEYALKPLDIDQFLTVLKKADGKIQKKKSEMLSPDQLLFSYINSKKEEKERLRSTIEEKLGINENVLTTIFLIHPENAVTEIYDEIQKRIHHILDALCMENYYLLTRRGESGGIYIFLVDTERNRNLKNIFASRVLAKIQEISFSVCTMVKMYGLDQIDQAIEQLNKLLPYTFSEAEGAIVDWESSQMIQYEVLEYPSALENELIQQIRNGKREKIIEKAELFCTQVIESNASPECIKDYTVRLIAGILRVVSERKIGLNREEEMQYILGNIGKSISRKEVRKQFEMIVKNVAVVEGDMANDLTDNGIVLNAISYIRENYGEQIGLGDVAYFCNVRSEYLSRRFKEETGIKFVDFLTNFRISMAKRFLLSGKYKVSEVSEKVGFSDQKYFQKVFKKICGVTPSEYKKENCR